MNNKFNLIQVTINFRTDIIASLILNIQFPF